MDSHIHDWLNLLIRMAHFISGIMWIGTSFYFVWLDSAFEPLPKTEKGIDGELYMVHGGFFYRVEKRRFGAGLMPKNLHWFIWEATLTWITGFLLLWVVYYLTNGAYLIDPQVKVLTNTQGTLIGLAVIFGGWFFYDGLFRSKLAKTKFINFFALLFVLGVIYFLTHTFSGRGAFIHLGAMFGTMMVLNVWVHILPNQRKIIKAANEGREPDYELGLKAKRRSMHNSYMTLGVLFIMISNHFSATYSHQSNWLILILFIAAGASTRHFMITFKKWALSLAIFSIGILFYMTMPPKKDVTTTHAKISFGHVNKIIHNRCLDCHSSTPIHPDFVEAPNGITYDTPEQIFKLKERIYQRVVVEETMPLGNLTEMTAEERKMIKVWYEAGGDILK